MLVAGSFIGVMDRESADFAAASAFSFPGIHATPPAIFQNNHGACVLYGYVVRSSAPECCPAYPPPHFHPVYPDVHGSYRLSLKQVTNDSSIYWLNKFVTNLVYPLLCVPWNTWKWCPPPQCYIIVFLLFREYCLFSHCALREWSVRMIGSSTIIAYSCCFKRWRCLVFILNKKICGAVSATIQLCVWMSLVYYHGVKSWTNSNNCSQFGKPNHGFPV